MNSRSIAILGALVAIVIAAAAWLGLSREQSNTRSQQLYPQAKSQLDQVKAVRLYGPGDVLKVELQRGASGWTVAQKSNYPADTSKVRQLLVGIAEAEILEEKTSNSSNYATLGVEDMSAADAKGTRVEWVGSETTVNLIVGKDGGGTNNHYVRRAGEQPSWLIKADVFTSVEPKEWLDKQFIDVSADRVQAAKVIVGDKPPYTAAKAARADANFKVEGLKKGQELSSENAANSVATALAHLILDDVRPYAEFTDKIPNAKATFHTFDGVVIELAGFEDGDARWIHARASFNPKLPEQFGLAASTGAAQVESEGNAKPQKNQLNREQEASQLDARVKEWVYRVPDYKYDAIFRPLSELLKD